MTGLRFVTIAVWLLVFRALSVAAPPAPPGFHVGYNVEKESPKLWTELARQIGERAELEKLRGQVWRPDLLPWASDRDPADMVLRRTEALWKDLVGRKAKLVAGTRSSRQGPPVEPLV